MTLDSDSPLRHRVGDVNEGRIRLLMLPHEHVPFDYLTQPIVGLRDVFESMREDGEIAAYEAVPPLFLLSRYGRDKSLNELLRITEAFEPNVVLVTHPTSFRHIPHNPDVVSRFLEAANHPIVLCWEGDAWGTRLNKPLNESMCAWLAAADVVFSVSLGGQIDVLRRAGARDIRFVPQVYCHVVFGDAETANEQVEEIPFTHDVVVIGNKRSRIAGFSRIPGVHARYRLIRRLQRQRSIELAIYGSRWKGRGVCGTIPFCDLIAAIQDGLMSANWDHFPHYASSSSNRLPISLLAGRVHVTTRHDGSEWLPGPEAGLFQEPSVSAVVRRVRKLVADPRDDVLARGAAAREWVRGRLSTRELGRYMLSAVEERLADDLPSDPWHQVAEMRF